VTGVGSHRGPGGSDAAGAIVGIGSARLRQLGTQAADGALADADQARDLPLTVAGMQKRAP
jgi:hypothetical protein